MTFGQRLKELRTEKKINQQQLSEILDTAKSNISKYESDKVEPNINMISTIAQYFNVSSDYLLGLSDLRLPYGLTEHAYEQTSLQDEMGQSIRYCICKSGLDDKEVAEKIGVSIEVLEDYCHGMVMPLEVLQKLSELCGVSTDYLLGLRDKSRPPSDQVYPFVCDPEISKRIKFLLKNRAANDSLLTSFTDLTEDETFNFVEYGFVPHVKVIADIAESFGVSADYLLNRTESTLTISKEEEKIISSYRQLDEDYQDIALGKIKELIKEQEKEKYMQNVSESESEDIDQMQPGKSLA